MPALAEVYDYSQPAAGTDPDVLNANEIAFGSTKR
jgi:hypothetical protein